MDPIRKAAIMLMSLPEDDAAKLMGLLSPKEVESVSIELARLGHVAGEEQEAVIMEFADASPNGLGGQSGGLGLAKSLVEKALCKNAASTIHSVQQQIEALPFGFLRNVDSQNLITFIIDEQPQTIALILSHLGPTLGAEVLAGLPTDRQLAVIRRVATMGQTNPDIIREVERGLESRMSSVMSQSFENAGGVPCVAEMLNVTDRSTERALLENMAEEDPDLVEEIRRLMFVFEDISKFSDKDIQSVLKSVESSQWAMALKGSSDAIKEKVLGNLSQRARDMLIEEMDYLGPVRLSAVEEMQQQIVDVVRRLEESGEIDLSVSEAEEEFIQ